MYVIFDIDNCLADDGWRISRIGQVFGTHGPRPAEPDENRYLYYHTGMEHDKPRNVEYFRDVIDRTRALPIFITARPAVWHWTTHRWLKKHFDFNVNGQFLLSSTWRIMMREPHEEGIHSPQLKVSKVRDFLDSMDLTPDLILRAYDDRQDVLDAYEHHFDMPVTQLKIHDKEYK